MTQLDIALLGAFQVGSGGRLIASLTSSKIKALLAYLAVEADQSHEREALAELLWPERPPGMAAQNLRQSLSRLQRAIPSPADSPPFLLITRQTVQFNLASRHRLDVAGFIEAMTFSQRHPHKQLEHCDACIDRLGQAAALYRGDFLQDVNAESAPFEEWALLKREWLRREALQALFYLTEHHLWQNDLAAAQRAALRQLELDAWREAAHRQLMRALALGGQRGEAVAQFQKLERLLRDELQVAPAAKTTRLFEQIRDGALDELRPGARHNLPRRMTPFVGREVELAEVAARLDDPTCALLTLVGPGGAGKTTLAVEVARQRAALYPDGVAFVPLAPIPSADLLPVAIGAALGLRFSERSAPAAQLIDHLRGKSALIMLDNFELLRVAGADLVLAILQQAPGVQLLVTSREVLDLRAEWLYDMGGLPFPTSPGSNVAEFAAIRLFTQEARRVRRDLSFDQAEQAAIVRLCQMVEGLPLAIELAASLARTHTCAEIAAAVEQSLDVLSTAQRDVPARQRSLRAVFDYSWALLSERERALLRQLTVFRGGFTLEGAEYVCAAPSELLGSLADKSLLQRLSGTDARGATRYDLHELIRQFASEKLETLRDESRSLRDQHCDYYSRLLATREDDLIGQAENVADLALEADNIRAAWDWAIANQQTTPIARSLEALVRFFSRCGWLYEAETVLERTATMLVSQGARESPEDAQSVSAKETTTLVGRVWARQGALADLLSLKGQKARNLLQKSLRILRRLGPEEEIAQALLALAVVDQKAGEFKDAWQRMDEGLRIARAIGSQRQVASALAELAFLAYLQRESDEGRQYGSECLEIFQQTGDLTGMGRILSTLGLLESQRPDFEKARRYLTESLGIYRQLNDTFRQAMVLNNLGLVAYQSGEYTEADRHFHEFQRVSQQVGEAYGVALALYNRGRVAHASEDYVRAKALHAEGLAVRRKMGNHYLCGISGLYLGKAHHALGEADQARACFYQALDDVVGSENVYVQLQILTAIAGELARARREDEALALLLFVLHHPAHDKSIGDFSVQEEAHTLLVTVRFHRSPPQVAQWQARVQAWTLEDVIQSVLQDHLPLARN